MKRTMLLCTMLCLILLSACKKDQDLQTQLQDQEAVQETFKRNCGMTEHNSKLMMDEDYRRNHELKLSKMAQSSSERSVLCNEPTIMPVAVHFQGISNPDNTCLIELAKTQIAIVNKDYQGTNDDINNWTDNASSSYPGISNGETCVRFCIASKNHPSGYNLIDGDLAVTINQTTGDQLNDWNGYINIFVRENLGFLGYSPLGGSGNGDGVAIDANAFSAGSGCGSVSPQSPYDLGRTLTHELGHYLLLDHVWGNNGGCNEDDDVSDTPVSDQPYYGCPTIGASSCSSTDLHMNYMDYTNDACMYMFTNGQAVRMENYFGANLQNVINNASNVCEASDDPADPTCTDGIQNGNETGVDCGGPDCAPCNEPTTCDTPANVDAQVQSATAVTISWTASAAAIAYEVQIRPAGSANWNSQEVNTTNYTFNGLQPSTSYQYRIRALCSTSEASPFSSIQVVTTPGDGGGGSDCDGTEVTFELTLDDYGSETTWYLVDENGSVLSEGGPFEDNADGTLIEEDFCLEDGCYYIVVFDEYGDGICCYYGEGSFQLVDVDGDLVASSNGEFGYFDYLDFCVRGGTVDSWGFRTDIRSAARSNGDKRRN